MEYGYVRAQKGQSLKRQTEIVTEYVGEENLIADETGEDGYLALKKKLQPGDLLVIKSLDRLGSSYEEILREWTQITEEICADILVLDMPQLDTRKREEGKFVGGIVRNFLEFAAGRERQRTSLQAQGIRKAKERGVRFGRPRLEYTEEFIATVADFLGKKITLAQALQKTGVKKSSFYYHVRRIEEKNLLQSQPGG